MKKIYCACFALIIIFNSCKKDQITVENKIEISSDVVKKLKAAGFDTSEGLTKIKDGYLVEYDIFIPEEDLENLSKNNSIKIPISLKSSNLKLQSKDPISHYRTNNQLVTSVLSKRDIKVFIDPAFGTYMKSALDEALQRYNNLDLTITFSRADNSSSSDINVWMVTNKSYLMSAGFPYGNGDPYDEILVNVDYFTPTNTRPDAASSFAHEIGHCIGFRHNDYMNRTFSCRNGAGSEGSGSVGDIYIPGTTSDPNANSWMLACSDNQNRPFTSDDILALKYLFSIRKNIYVKSIMTLISDDSHTVGCCDDRSLASWNVRAEFYQDAAFTIPYTTANYFVLNTYNGPTTVFQPMLVVDGVTFLDLGVYSQDIYYSYGTEVSNNSTGYQVAAFSGYWMP